MFKRSTGISLVMTLWIATLILITGLVLSTLATTHLQFSSRLESQIEAEAIAESAVAAGLERLIDDPEFGIDSEAAASLTVELNDSKAHLSFHPDTSSSWDIPLSQSNRFNLEAMVAADGTLLPSRSVRLIAVGEAGNARKTVEAILQVPEFPYAIASTGPVVSDGSLVVGSVTSLDALESGISDDDLQPGDLASNHSVDISGDALITGTVKSHGSITLSDSVEIKGKIDEYSDKVELLGIDVPALRPVSSEPLSDDHSDVLVSDSRHFADPSLVVSDGLTMDQGVLFVNGDLHIRGGLQGEGALIVNGDIVIEGGAAFAAEEQLAVIATGDVTIRGEGKLRSVFQGLIYTEGDLSAEDTTLLGVFVANGSDSQVRLHDVRVLHYAEYGEFKVDGVAFVVFFDDSGYSGDPSGEKSLILLTVDERDADTVREARGTKEEGGSGTEGSMPDGGERTVPPPIPLYLPLIRGRMATSVDGVLTTDWTELDAGQVEAVVYGVQGDAWENLVFTNFEADPNLKIVKEIRTSFVFDLNRFLVPTSQSRLIYWNSY